MALNQLRINLFDPCLGMDVIGSNFHLIAKKGDALNPFLFDRHGKQGNCYLLAGRKQNIHFPPVGKSLHMVREFDKAVGFTGHCRQNYDHLVFFQG